MHPDLLVPAMVEPFIPLAKEIDQDKDKRLAGCMRTLSECVSMHSAATWLLDNEPWISSRSITTRSITSATAS